MQHEILLALAGCPGSTFSVSKQSGLLEVIPDLPFIHPSEVSLLNKISSLGTYYLQLTEFISLQTASCTALGHTRFHDGNSLYLKAMAYGIDEVLDAFRQKLVALEEKLMGQPHLPISWIQQEFEDYHFLIPALDSCVRYVQNHKLHGCQILSYLHQQCSSGVTSIKAAFERILCVCHGVFYKQLSAWMLHGLLLDHKGEFFIERMQSKHEERETEDGDEAEALSQYNSRDISQFRINERLTPSYLPPRVLEKILFIGEAVQIFHSLNTCASHPRLPSFSTGSGFHLHSDQVKFSMMLTQLQNSPVFRLREFEGTVEYIRNIVAQHLWKVLVEESNLFAHLQIIKDIFLLGRGELFLSFVDMADTLMKLPPTATTQHDVNVAFRQAMIKVAMDHEDLTKQFQLTVTGPTTEFGREPRKSIRKLSAWKSIGMGHNVSWPLQVVFTTAALEKYSSLFHFLLSLRRAQIALQQCWALLMSLRAHTQKLQAVWQLRAHMGFLVDNLQYYVQVDVLETQYTALVEKIRSTHDFETVKNAHSDFLGTLQSQLFFSLEPIRRSISEILELCFCFSELVQGLGSGDVVFSSEKQNTLECITMEFTRQSSLLFRVLSTIRNHHSAPHLSQLLLRVDYNKYFTNSYQ